MKRIAKFEKVSLAEFEKSFRDSFPEDEGATKEEIARRYEEIFLPTRATTGSAGYDFRATKAVTLMSGESVKMPTGIRVRMEEGWVLLIVPRSGLGFRYRLQLANTVGVIDSDYYGSDNEGHILIKITNDSKEGKALTLDAGAAFAQGIFTEYGITVDDATESIRNGGLGSTT